MHNKLFVFALGLIALGAGWRALPATEANRAAVQPDCVVVRAQFTVDDRAIGGLNSGSQLIAAPQIVSQLDQTFAIAVGSETGRDGEPLVGIEAQGRVTRENGDQLRVDLTAKWHERLAAAADQEATRTIQLRWRGPVSHGNSQRLVLGETADGKQVRVEFEVLPEPDETRLAP